MATATHLGLFGTVCDIFSEYPPKAVGTDETVAVGSFTYYPVKMPLYYAHRFFLGAKNWKMSFAYESDIDLSFASGNATVPSNYLSGSYIRTNGVVNVLGIGGGFGSTQSDNFHNLAIDEKDLFCIPEEIEQTGMHYQWSIPITFERRIREQTINGVITTTDTVVELINFEIQTNISVQIGFIPNFSKSENPEDEDIWAAFYVRIGGSGATAFTGFRSDFSDPPTSINATLKILDKDFIIPLGGLGTVNIPYADVEISNVVITPAEWWTYSGTYNATTGI